MKRICIISFAILLVISLTSCGKPKTALSADAFQSQMEEAGFEVVDATDELSEDDADNFETALAAYSEDGSYRIEFFVTPDDSKANKKFNNVKNNFKAEKEGASSESSVSVSNHSKYSLNSNDQYYVVSKIGNTFLYVVTDSENKDTVNSVLTALGY